MKNNMYYKKMSCRHFYSFIGGADFFDHSTIIFQIIGVTIPVCSSLYFF